MEFSDRNPEDASGGYSELPPADDFSFSGEPVSAGQAGDQAEPEIFASPDLEGYAQPEAGAQADVNDLRVPSAETARDMPYAERETFLGVAKGFAEGGESYTQRVYESLEEGAPLVEMPEEQGHRRKIPPGALAAEGLDFDQVEVTTISGSGVTYDLTLEASKAAPVDPEDIESLYGEPPREVKVLEFNVASLPGMAPITTMNAYSYAVTGDMGVVEAHREGPEGPSQTYIPAPVYDDNAPTMDLDTARALMRAMENADHFPDTPPLEFERPSAMDSALKGADPSGVELPAEGTLFTDLPQSGRAALMDAIDRYARQGECTVVDPQHSVEQKFAHEVPAEILREHGIEARVEAKVIDDPDPDPEWGHYQAGLRLTHPARSEVTFPDGSSETLDGERDISVIIFAPTGTRSGGERQRSRDPTGGVGLHVVWSGHEKYTGPDGTVRLVKDTYAPDYEQMRGLLGALRQALAD